MVLEGLVTTINADGTVNIAPMGPLVDPQMQQFVLRPYRTSRTYANLRRTRQGVLHVTDNVEMLAQAAVGQIEPLPELVPAGCVDGMVIADTCRWYEFRVVRLEDQASRTTLACNVVDAGRIRDFFGFNRAKHAVIEAAIMASRLNFLPADAVRKQCERLAVLVEKTAGPEERRAFEFLRQYINAHHSQHQPSES